MKLFSSIGIIALLGCMSAGAYAQSAPTEYKLVVKATELDKLGKALGTLPFNEVADLMASLRQQIVEQQQAAQAPKADGNNKEDKK